MTAPTADGEFAAHRIAAQLHRDRLGYDRRDPDEPENAVPRAGLAAHVRLVPLWSGIHPAWYRRYQAPTLRRVPARRGERLFAGPPVALPVDVVPRRIAETGRPDDEDLQAVRPGLVATPRARGDTHRVPFLELDDLVVELHAPAPAHDHVDLLLLHMRMAVRKAVAGRDALVAEARFLEPERERRRAELEVRRPVEPGADVLQVLLDVLARERHVEILSGHARAATGVRHAWASRRGRGCRSDRPERIPSAHSRCRRAAVADFPLPDPSAPRSLSIRRRGHLRRPRRRSNSLPSSGDRRRDHGRSATARLRAG